MSTVNIIIADDEQSIHEDIRKSLDSINFDYKIVKDFMDVASLKKYLYLMNMNPDNEGVDVLILDHFFGGASENGLEALPQIRNITPKLPIIFLTTFDDTEFSDASELYNDVDYQHKPVQAVDLRYRIKKVIQKAKEWEDFQKALKENKEFEDYLLKENEKLENAQYENANTDTQLDKALADESPILPPNMLQLIENIFPDVEFKPSSFSILAKRGAKKADWNRMFRLLKIIDWKNEINAGAGAKVQKYKEYWEYRFSQAGRIFVERRANAKPLIILIDPFHSYSKMPGF